VIQLTQDQLNVIAWLNAGHNVFLTGVAGVGKTAVINAWLDQVPTGKNVGIAASTGIAATHIGGSTLHSWIGATPERDTMTRLCNATWAKKYGPRLKAIHSLIIDEVSMVDAAMFTLAEGAHRAARESVQPWGGIQIILVGDLGQLPPVEAEEKGWCFQSPAWAESKIQVLELTQVMRQGDQRFADLLRRVRVGHVDDEVLAVLGARVRAFDPDSAIRLVTHNAQCDNLNDAKLASLPGEEHTFRAKDTGQEPHLSALKKSCLSPEVLKLKVGARVMFTKNDLDGAWVNGSMGEVLGFGAHDEMDDEVWAVDVRLSDGEIVSVQPVTWGKKQWEGGGHEGAETLRQVASRTQYPLRLAWAITIHKSQGATMDRVSMDLGRTFAPGQAYVALSRCRTLEGINIESWRGADSIIAHPMLRQATAGQGA
jgi:ATP-dependent exoDNAse (exonuclease V) alpha subunit